jgi:outer membrane receptor for ferrienterochelin and colicin
MHTGRENRMNPDRSRRDRKTICLLVIACLLICAAGAFSEKTPAEQPTDLFELSIEQLMEIDVASTATLTMTKPRLVPASVTTITEEEITASGARSLYELLDIYVPNLQWIRHHWEGDHMGLRGIINDRDDKYLLLVNGRNMNERTHSGATSERDMVLLSDIHHIDVVRGPGSALYGPGAVSMVINIVTHSAKTFEGTEIKSRTGAVEEFYTAEIKHGKKFEDNDGGLFWYAGIGKYVGAGKEDAEQIFPLDFPSQIDAPDWLPSWGPNPATPPWMPTYGLEAGEGLTQGPVNRDGADQRGLPPLKLFAQMDLGDWTFWTRYTRGGKQYLYSPGMWALPYWGYGDGVFWDYDDGTGIHTRKDTQPNFYGYQQLTGYVGYTQELADNLNVDYGFSYDTFHFTQYRQNAVSDAYREDEYYGKILLRWQANEKHSFAFGGEISHQELGMKAHGWPDMDPLSQRLNDNTIPMERWSTNMYSILGEHQWTINDQWTSFLGARLDNHTYTSWMFSPRAALVHTPNPKDTWKLMWSRSVRANVEEEMRYQAETLGGDSDPEVLDSAELRYERKQSKNLDLAATIFVHYNLDVISWDGSAAQTLPIGSQQEYGVELEAMYHTDTTRLIFSHGFTKLLDFKLEEGRDTYITAKPYGYGDDLANWSNHISKITLEHDLSEKLTFDASLRYYWGFPGMEDYADYDPYGYPPGETSFENTGTTYPDGSPFPEHRFVEDGWEKAYRCNLFLNMGLEYKASKNLTLGLNGYNLLGIFDKNLNKRNYIASNADYRTHAPSVSFTMTYKW